MGLNQGISGRNSYVHHSLLGLAEFGGVNYGPRSFPDISTLGAIFMSGLAGLGEGHHD